MQKILEFFLACLWVLFLLIFWAPIILMESVDSNNSQNEDLKLYVCLYFGTGLAVVMPIILYSAIPSVFPMSRSVALTGGIYFATAIVTRFVASRYKIKCMFWKP